MNEKTFFRVVFFFSVVMFASGLALGVFSGNGHKIRATELEDAVNRLTQQVADATERADRIAVQLERATTELAVIRGRISVAQGIADELTSGTINAIDTVDRIIRKVELLESALSVILDW